MERTWIALGGFGLGLVFATTAALAGVHLLGARARSPEAQLLYGTAKYEGLRGRFGCTKGWAVITPEPQAHLIWIGSFPQP